jgi:Tfp pilus assembly protein PilO
LVTAITEQARQGTGEENAHFQGILRAELRLLRDQLAQMEERIKRLEGQLDMAGCQ